MIKYGRLLRKAVAAALLASMTAVMIGPVSTYAEDVGNTGKEMVETEGEDVSDVTGDLENKTDNNEGVVPDTNEDVSESVEGNEGDRSEIETEDAAPDQPDKSEQPGDMTEQPDDTAEQPDNTGGNVVKAPRIETVTLAYDGEFVKKGQSVEITVKVANHENVTSADVGFRAILGGGEVSIPLYDTAKGEYKGVWNITGDEYACEWYVDRINILDSAGNHADDTAFTKGNSYPYYVELGTADYIKGLFYGLNVKFHVLDENGKWNQIEEVTKDKVKRRTTLKEAGVEFPEAEPVYLDFKQIGWMDKDGNEITEDTQVIDRKMDIYARYDKTSVEYRRSFLAEDGRSMESDCVKENLPSSSTYQDMRKKALSLEPPKVCPSGLTFQGWKVKNDGEADGNLLNGKMDVSQEVTAVYDQNIVTIRYLYFNEQNEWCSFVYDEIMEKGVTYQDAMKEAEKYLPTDISKDYPIEEWECSREDSRDVIIDRLGDISFIPKYSGKVVVPVRIEYQGQQMEEIVEERAVLVEEGTTVGEVKNLLNEIEKPEINTPVQEKWKIYIDKDDDSVIENGQSALIQAQYDGREEVPGFGGGIDDDMSITIPDISYKPTDPSLPDDPMDLTRKPLVETFDFNYQNQIVGQQNILIFSLSTQYTYKDSKAFATFIHESGEGEKVISMKREGDGTYNGTALIGKAEKDGMWFLKEIYVVRDGFHQELMMDEPESYFYMLKRSVENDTESPKITSVNVEKNGEFVQVGQSVRITVGATDNSSLLGFANLYLKNLAQDGSREVALRYNVAEDVFEGTFTITDDMRSGEWFVDKINIWDGARNCADDNEFTKGGRYPYYLKVKNGEEYTEAVRDVYIEFFGWDEQGEWSRIQTVYKKDVSLRTTVKDLGITFPERKFSDFNITGWVDGSSSKEITGDTMVPNGENWVINGVYDQARVAYVFCHVSKNGENLWDTSFRYENFPIGTTFGEVKAEAVKYYESIETYPGLHIKDWDIYEQISDDEKVETGYNLIHFLANYDEDYLRVRYSYFNDAGKWCNVYRPIVINEGMVYKEVLEQAKQYRPEDLSKEYPFDGWDGDIPETKGNFRLIAKYQGKKVVTVSRSYYDEKGQRPSSDIALLVDEGTTRGEVKEILNQWEKPAMYQGLRFTEWDFPFYGEDESIVGNRDSIKMKAIYENCIVRYILDSACEKENMNEEDVYGYDVKEDLEFIYCQVVEKGDTVTVPTSFEGYESVTWSSRAVSADSFDVVDNVDFYGYGKKTEAPQNPEQTEISKEEIAEVIDQINKVVKEDNPDGNGDTPVIPIEMNNAKILPWEILEAVKGKDIAIELKMGMGVEGGFQYTWTIKGSTIEDDFKSINLGVAADKNAIPQQIVQKLAGTNPIQQLTLEHSGKFGFEASLSINVGSQHAGRYGNLFYFNNGKMQFMNTAKVDQEGNVALGFNHASDYVVVMSDEEMSQASVPEDLQPDNKETEEDTDKDGDEDNGDGVNKNDGDKDGANKGDNGSNGDSNQGNQNSGVNKDTDNNKVSDTNSADKTGGDIDAAGHRRSAKTGDGNKTMPLVLCSILALGVMVSIRRRSTRSI